MPELPQPFFGAVVNGVDVYPQDKISYRIDTDYTTPADGWSFTVYREDSAKLRAAFQPWMPVELYIDGKLILFGRIEDVEGDGTGALHVSGVDYLGDIIRGQVDPTTKFKKDDTLGDAILRVLSPFGITKLESNGYAATRSLLTGKTPKDKTPPRDFNAVKLDEFKVGYSQGAFETANRIAARHGFTLQPGASRDSIALAEPDYEQAAIGTIRRDAGSNVVNARARRNWSNVPTQVTVVSKAKGKRGAQTGRVTIPAFGDGAPNKLASVPEVQRILAAVTSAPKFEVEDLPELGVIGGALTVLRPLYHQDKEARNDEQIERVARRILADKLRDTLTYECTVVGHKDPKTGARYAPDTMWNVIDPIEGVEEQLWILGRTFRNDGQGAMTDLRMIRPYTWVL